MRRILVALAAVLLSASAYATTTYSSVSAISVKAVCTTGSESAPTLSTEGMSLQGVSAIAIQVCADSGQTITGGSGIQLYEYDASGLWGYFNGTIYTVKTGARCAWLQGDSPGLGIPVIAGRGRLAAVPVGITVSSGSVTIYHYAVTASGPR